MSRYTACFFLLIIIAAAAFASPIDEKNSSRTLSRRQLTAGPGLDVGSVPIVDAPKPDEVLIQLVKTSLTKVQAVTKPNTGRGLQVVNPSLSRAAAAILDEVYLVADKMVKSNRFSQAMNVYSLLSHAKSIVTKCAVGKDRNIPDCLKEFASLGVDMVANFLCTSAGIGASLMLGPVGLIASSTVCSVATFYLTSVIKYAILHQAPLEGLLGKTNSKLSRGIVSGNYEEAYQGLNIIKDGVVDLVQKVNSMDSVTETVVYDAGLFTP